MNIVYIGQEIQMQIHTIKHTQQFRVLETTDFSVQL